MNMANPDVPENALGGGGDVSMFVHPSARVYILVRGLLQFLDTEGYANASRRPSYDYNISTTQDSHRERREQP
jgi:hypothetical protein